MRLFIVRHGETDWNKEGKVQGHTDIPLNEHGRCLAQKTAKGLQHIKFDLAFTSPLIRAKETAQILLGDRQIPLYEDERIKEICFGSCEGLTCKGENLDPGSEEFNKFFTDTARYIPSNGAETIEQLYERTGNFLKELTERNDLDGKQILISTHGAAMTALLNRIDGNMKIDNFWKNKVPKNCAVTVIDVQCGIPVISEREVVYY